MWLKPKINKKLTSKQEVFYLKMDRLQRHLADRATDYVSFVDKRAVKEAVAMVLRSSVGNHIFPQSLSLREISAVRTHMYRNHGDLGNRVSFVPGVPMEQGTGTRIIIRPKRERRENA